MDENGRPQKENIVDTESELKEFEPGMSRTDGNENSNFLGSEKPKGETGLSFRRLKSDARLRHKCLHTVCIALGYMASGWRDGIIGPTMPDLSLIIDADLVAISWVVSAMAFGGLVGSLGTGLLYDRFNKCIVFVIITFFLAMTSIATPWCSTFPSMVAIHALNGVFLYGLGTVNVADMGLVWKHNSGPAMQVTTFAYSLGGTISPLTTEPFFAERRKSPHNETYLTYNGFSTKTTNITEDDTSVVIDRNMSTVSPVSNNELTYGETHIHYAYMIAGAMSLAACVCMLVQFCTLGSVHATTTREYTEKDNTEKVNAETLSNIRFPLSRNWKFIFVGILSLFLCLHSTTERLFNNYLVVFVIKRFKFNTAEGAKLSTFFWAIYTISRLLSIVVMKLLKPVFVFAVFLCILILGEISMLIAANHSTVWLLWISAGLYGLGLSAIGGSVFGWLSAKVCRMTGTISSVMVTVLIVGAIVYPQIIGNIMNSYSFDWYVYLALILTGLMLALTFIMEGLYRILT